jgi:RNA polymerase sigma-70 factor (ECF subfamily)
MRTVDLYLARACILELPGAVAAFEAQLFPEIDAALGHLGVEHAVVDETKQVLREKLFVRGASDAPLLANYAGRGSLRSWLRAIAVRTAMRMIRVTKRNLTFDEDGLFEMPSPADSPELHHFKQYHRDDFKAALSHALAALAARERTILRQHFLDGLNIDQLGALYRVHRSTAARWIAAARKSVLERTHQLMKERLRLHPTELNSFVRLLQSNLDVSIERLLQSEVDEGRGGS